MIKISDEIRNLIKGNSLLQFGIHYRLLNLAQLSKFLKPQIEARTKKEVSSHAIHMSLSRIQRDIYRKWGLKEEKFEIENINIHSNLIVYTFANHGQNHTRINKLYSEVKKQKGYITITEGVNEITIILDSKFVSHVNKIVKVKPKFKNPDIVSVGVKFNEKYLEIPGLLYVIMQQVVLQNINIIEIASTMTEMIFYVHKDDAQLAFETIYSRFS